MLSGGKAKCSQFCTTGMDGGMSIWDVKVKLPLHALPIFSLTAVLGPGTDGGGGMDHFLTYVVACPLLGLGLCLLLCWGQDGCGVSAEQWRPSLSILYLQSLESALKDLKIK